MTDLDLVVAGGTVVTPELGRLRADVGVAGETIACLASPGTLSGDRVVDARGNHVFPGVVDPHTHFGFYRSLAEDAESESRSGLVGGVTTTGNMWRTPDPYLERLDDLLGTAENRYYSDFFLTLGPLTPTHVDEIPDLVEEYGVTTYKWLQHYKGTLVDRFGVDREMDDRLGDDVMAALASLDVPTTLGYHSENVEIRRPIERRLEASGRDDYGAFEESFPGYAETQSMVAGAALARQHDYDDSFYAVHVSSRRTADELAALHRAGYRVTGETCTHYLTLTAEECDDRMKVGPPIRHEADRETLWERVADGTIQCVATDHTPNTLDVKVGETIWDSKRGFPSNPAMLPLVLSEGYHEGRISLERAVAVTSTNNARAWNIYPEKGSIRVGTDADLVVVDLDETRTVTPELLGGAADYSVYDGREVTGWPSHTVVRGRVCYAEGRVEAEPGHGEHIERPV